jgi:hypothetical protein
MEQSLGLKELYEVSLKATYPIEMNGETIEVGETIACFDKISLANFQEIKTSAKASGGYDDRTLIWWEEIKEIKLSFSQGVFSKTQLALMMNAKMLSNNGPSIVSVHKIEALESDENGAITLTHVPNEQIFVYNKGTGKKIKNWTRADNIIYINEHYQDVVVDYYFNYDNGYTTLQFGQPFARGVFSLTGKTRIKDDVTGKVTTGIINIPKLRLMSGLSMRLGNDAIPHVGRLDAVALPEGARGNKKIMEIIFLNDDIDADM